MNLASRGRLPSLASETASDALTHGFAPKPDSEDAVNGEYSGPQYGVETASHGFDGNGTVEIISTSWDFSRPKDSFFGVFWKGRANGSNTLTNKKQDLQNTFGGSTPRRFCMMYSISEHNNVDDFSENYYDPVINGDDDQEYINMANELVSMGMEDTLIRPNPEHTRDGYPRYPADANGNDHDPATAGQKYADAYAHVVDLMMGVSGAEFEWVFSPGGKFSGADIGAGEGPTNDIAKESWPLNSSNWPSGVDPPHVCESYYDSVDNGGPTASEWVGMTDQEKEDAAITQWVDNDKPNFDSYTEWAQNDLGAPRSLIEWGTKVWDDQVGDGNARGDNPWFIDLVINYLRNNGGGFHHIFSHYHSQPQNSVMWEDGQIKDKLAESFDALRYQVIHGEGKYIATNP